MPHHPVLYQPAFGEHAGDRRQALRSGGKTVSGD